MEIAALISFAILLVAWLMAPDGQTSRTSTVVELEREAVPATI
jgi:hypothetical protein